MKLINGIILVVTYTEITNQSDIGWLWIATIALCKVIDFSHELVKEK